MEHQVSSVESAQTLLASSDQVNVYTQPTEKPKGFFKSFPPTLTTVDAGYKFKIHGEKADCYGTHIKRTTGVNTYKIFSTDEKHTTGVNVLEAPEADAKAIFLLAPLEAVRIIETLDDFYQVELPGKIDGFVDRNLGVRRDWFSSLQSHFGYYGVKKSEARTVNIRFAPDMHSDVMMELTTHFRLPVAEEWDNWFKVQLPDGSMGFVPEAYGNRTITATTLVDKPSEGSVLRGLLGVAGLLALGAVGAGLQSNND